MKRRFSIELAKGTKEIMIAIPSNGDYSDYNFFVDISEGELSKFKQVSLRTRLVDDDTIVGGNIIEKEVLDGTKWVTYTKYEVPDLGVITIEVHFREDHNTIEVYY